MPYITHSNREKLEPELSDIETKLRGMISLNCKGKGSLTYVFYRLGLAMIEHSGDGYTNISNILGCFRDAETELRRRVLNPYEESVIERNGDITTDSGGIPEERYQEDKRLGTDHEKMKEEKE